MAPLRQNTVKPAATAEVGAPECWVVNLEERCVEVFREPVDGRYARHEVHGEEATVHPLAFPDVAVPVARLLLDEPGATP